MGQNGHRIRIQWVKKLKSMGVSIPDPMTFLLCGCESSLRYSWSSIAIYRMSRINFLIVFVLIQWCKRKNYISTKSLDSWRKFYNISKKKSNHFPPISDSLSNRTWVYFVCRKILSSGYHRIDFMLLSLLREIKLLTLFVIRFQREIFYKLLESNLILVLPAISVKCAKA